MRWLTKKGIAGGALLTVVWCLAAPGEESAPPTKAELAAKNLKSIEAAVQDLKDKCGVTILQDEESPDLPDKIDCGKGPEALDAAWIRFLVSEGVPGAPEERQSAAEQMGLSPSMTLIYMEGTARSDAIENLMNALRNIAGKQP